EARRVGVELDGSAALPRGALWAEWTRRAGLGGKHERATAIVGRAPIAGGLSAGAGAGPSLQIELKVGLDEVALILQLGHFGDQGPSAHRECRPRLASAVGAVSQRRLYLTPGG